MRNPWLCIINLGSLAAGALLMTAGIIAITYAGHEAPAALWTMAGSLWGALSSFLVMPPRNSVGINDQAKAGP